MMLFHKNPQPIPFFIPAFRGEPEIFLFGLEIDMRAAGKRLDAPHHFLPDSLPLVFRRDDHVEDFRFDCEVSQHPRDADQLAGFVPCKDDDVAIRERLFHPRNGIFLRRPPPQLYI